MILTHLWPWNKVKVIKPGVIWSTPNKVIIMRSLKKPCLKSVGEIADDKVFIKSGNTSIFSLESVWKSKIGVYSWPALGVSTLSSRQKWRSVQCNILCKWVGWSCYKRFFFFFSIQDLSLTQLILISESGDSFIITYTIQPCIAHATITLNSLHEIPPGCWPIKIMNFPFFHEFPYPFQSNISAEMKRWGAYHWIYWHCTSQPERPRVG